jgi:hypothetical protein
MDEQEGFDLSNWKDGYGTLISGSLKITRQSQTHKKENITECKDEGEVG